MIHGGAENDQKFTMNAGCETFKVGDQIELSSPKTGNYELNMITAISMEGFEDGTPQGAKQCDFHIAYPMFHSHSEKSSVSKFVKKDWLQAMLEEEGGQDETDAADAAG